MDRWPCQLSIFIGALLFWGLWLQRACWGVGLVHIFLLLKKKHIWRGKEVMWLQKKKKKKKESMAHRETEVKRFLKMLSYSSHSLQWTFCKCLISTVFDLALFLRGKKWQLLTCVFEDDNDEKKKSYCMTSLASHMWPLFQLTCELWYWRTKPIMYHL